MEESLTSPGTALGTVALHVPETSPRQGTGRPNRPILLWSGPLRDGDGLYCRFRGESTGDIFDSILNRAPVPPVRLQCRRASGVRADHRKCLEKDRNLRYQNASGKFRTDLQRMRRDTDSARVTADSKPRASTGIAKRWRAIVSCCRGYPGVFVAGYFYFQSAPGPRAARLTDKELLSSPDFINTTGDAVFAAPCARGSPSNSSNRPF